MSDQRTNAIIAMLAIVVALYALRSGHAHLLPDMIGLALALAAPRQELGIGAWLAVVMVRHTRLAVGLKNSVPTWLMPIVLPAAHHMSISEDESSSLESAYKEAIRARETNKESIEIPQPVAENSEEMLSLGEIRALARLVAAGKLKRTEAIQIGTGKKSGAAYQERTRMLAQELERIKNHYPPGSSLKRFD